MTSEVAVGVAVLILGVAFRIWVLRVRAASRKTMLLGAFTDRYGTCLSCGREPVWSNDRVLEDIQLTRTEQERVSALAGNGWTLLKPGT